MGALAKGLLRVTLVLQAAACATSGGGASSDAGPDTSAGAVPEGGCLKATDCPSGSHCDCGFLNVTFASAGCESAGQCVTALASCDPEHPDTLLCDADGGGCPLGGTCGSLGFCSSPCPPADAGAEGGGDAGVDAGQDASDAGPDVATADGG